MELTVLQIIGIGLIILGGYGYYRGNIPWSFEIGPGGRNDSTIHIDLTPDEFKYRKEGVLEGKWVQPFCALIVVIGFILLVFIPGETVAFKI